MFPLISICIPAYGQPELLKRCLQSIADQNYPNIEVIISDDTPDESVKIVSNDFAKILTLTYFQNKPALGSPANWNAALNKANGAFSLLLHHDDWLAKKHTLHSFSKPLLDEYLIDAVFGNTETVNRKGVRHLQHIDMEALHKQPMNLAIVNKIGPPGNLMFRTNIPIRYDSNYQWLVDIEFYVQLVLSGCRLYHVPEKLIEVGIHEAQTTNIFQQNPVMVLEEYVLFAHKYHSHFTGWKLYDTYWRLIRDTKKWKENIQSDNALFKGLPEFIQQIVSYQKNVPARLLNNGLFSKLFMITSYYKNGF